MTEKLCLQWNDFKENVNSAFGRLKNDREFTDVTLACHDGRQMEAHKVILACSSPFFEKILQKNKHPHPLIYLKGFHSRDFLPILDFLYFGEANVFQEDLDSFLAIAEEIQLKGLTEQTSNDLIESKENTKLSEPMDKNNDMFQKAKTYQQEIIPKEKVSLHGSTAVVISDHSRTDLQALDEKVKSMMEKSQNIYIPNGKNPNVAKQKAYICKVCGKEGLSHHLRDHIEANHLEGISIPCEFCEKSFKTRINLNHHRNKVHK